MADITKTGPVGLRGLGGLSREDALIQKAAQSIPGYDMNARQISQEYTPAPVQHLGMQLAELGAGNSSYDRNITDMDQARDLNDYRFFSQSGFGQLVNGTLKMGTNAITTALDGTIGTLVGIGQGIYNLFDDNPKTGFWQGMWDNDFNKAMSNIQNNMENVLPNYYSTAQQNSSWDSAANLLSANFVGDKLLKNAGFTIGMLATTLTPGINGAWVAKAVQGLGKVFTGAEATNNIMSASKIADRVAKTFIAAHSEAVTEAINAVQGEQKDVYNNLDNKLNIARQSIQNQYAQNIKNGVAPDEAMKAYKRDMANMTNAYNQAKAKADNDMIDIGNSTYFMNIALLSLTNNLEFSKYLKGGFNLQKGARLYQMLDKGIPVNDAEAFGKAIAHGTASLKNNIVPAASAKGVAGILAGTAGKFAEEGFEEGAQDMISDSAQLQAEAKLNQWAEQKYRQDKDRYSLFASKINPGATDEMTDRLKAMGKTWENDFGDFSKSGWQDVFLGGLTGTLGTLGIVRNKTGHIGVGWQGGFVDQIREANDNYGQNQAKIEEANKRLSDPVTAENARHAVAAITFANDMNQGIRDNNVKMFKNAELMSTVNDALFFKNNGLLDSYKSFYEEAAKGINDKDVAAVRSQMQELGTGKSYFDGLTDQQLKDLLQHKAASTLDRINSTLDTYEDQNLKYRQTFDKIDPAMSTSAVEQLTSLKTLYWDLNNRKDDLERQKNNADDTDDTDYDSQINSVQKSMDQVKNEYKLYTKNPQSLMDELHDVADRMKKQADGKDDKKSIENYQKASTLDDAAQVYFYNRKPETLDSAIDSAEGNNKQLLQQFKPFITQVNSLHKIVTDTLNECAPDEQSRDNLTHAIGGIVDTAINNVLQDKDTGYDKQALIDEIKRMSDNVSDHKFVDHNGKEVDGVGQTLSIILDDISHRLKTVDDIQRASTEEKNEVPDEDEYTSEDENGISITDGNGNNVVKNEPKRINVNQKDIKDGVISDGTKIRSQLKESLPDYREEEDEGRIHIYNGHDYVGTVGIDNLFKVSRSSSDKYFNIVNPVSGKSKTAPKEKEEPIEKPATEDLEKASSVVKNKKTNKKNKEKSVEGDLFNTDNNVKKVLDKVASNKLVKKLHTDKESWNRIIKDKSVIARLRKESVVYTPEENSIIERARKNGTFMKAPNGNNTNLTQRQWVQVRTKSFKKWFGDWENDSKNASKVVDENGEPLVVYHGSPVSGFTIFKNGVHQATNGGKFASGYFFTTDLNAASRYADIHNYNKDLNGKTKEFRKRGIIDKLLGRQSKVIPNSERIREENRPVLNSEMNEGSIYDLMDKARDRGVINTNGIYACFLNIRNPKKADFKGESWANSPEKIPSLYGVQTSRQYNFDEKGRYKVENNTKNFNTLKEAQNYLDELKRNNSDKKTHTSKELGDESFEITSGGYAIREDSHFTPNKEYIHSYLIEYKIPQTINGLVDKAARDGYDGVDADNIVDANTEDNYPIHEFIPLNSNQIKSADSNIGKFDTGNPDIRKMVKSDGTVYGLVTNDGEIYLNPDNIDINTPIHEYTHLWWTIASTETKNKIINLLKTTDLWDSLSDNKNYSSLSTDEQKADEIFARYTAVRGENNIDKLLNNNDKGKIRNAINTLFNWLKSSFSKLFGISNSLDNFSDMTLRQLFEDKTTVVPDNGNVQTENNVSTVENTKALPLPNSSYRSNAFQQYEDDISKEGSKNKGTARERKAESAKKFREFLKNENIDIDHITNYRLHDLMKNGKLNVSYMTIDGRPDDIFLTIPYTSDVEKIVSRSEGKGNIVKTNEGESLIVGVQGFFYTKGNQSLLDGHNILKQKIADERKQNAYKGKYYVSGMGNQIYDVSPGSAVRQYENEERNDSNVNNLLNDKKSNPYGLKAKDLVWGVAEGNADEGTVNMKYINADGKQVVSPDNLSPGKVYLYVPASDGTYIPMYITPKVYNDAFDHTEINKLVRGIVNAPDIKARKTEINKLRDILMFSYGNNIYYDDETNKLNYRKGNLREDKEIDFENGNKEQQIIDFYGILKDLNPRINLSTSVLSTNPEFYLKSGLVNTGTRVLGTVNAQGYLYPVDKNGNPITSFKSRSEANNMVVKTIAARPVWVNGEKFLYNGELYTDTNGNPLDDKKTMYVKDIRGIMTGQGKTVNISNYDYHEINGRVYIMTKNGEYQQLTGSMLNKYESLRKEWQAEKDRESNRINQEPTIKTVTSDILDNAPEEVKEFANKNKGKILYSSDIDMALNNDRKAIYNELKNNDKVTSKGNKLYYNGDEIADIDNNGKVIITSTSILSNIAVPINYGDSPFIMKPERSDEVTDIPPKGYDDYVNGLMADEKKNNEKPVSTTPINGVDTKIAKNDKENSDNRANISNFENTYKKYGNKAALKEVIQQLTGKKVKNAKEVKEILLGSSKEVAGLASNVKTSADIDKIIEALKDCGI